MQRECGLYLDALLDAQPPHFLHKQKDSVSPVGYVLVDFIKLKMGEILQQITPFLIAILETCNDQVGNEQELPGMQTVRTVL